MASVTKQEQGMLDLIRSYFMKMRKHSDKPIESIHVSKAQAETFAKMKKKIEGPKAGGLCYGGVEFSGDSILVDGVKIKYKGGK